MIPDRAREAQFQTWLKEHRGIFHRIARAYAATAEDQADLFQEMAGQLWRSLPGFRGQCQAVTWIYRVCLNTALGWRRGSARRQAVVSVEAGAIDAAQSTEPRPGWTHEQEELLAKLYARIRALPVGERSLVLLSLDGLSYREIGELTGLKENHVGVVLTRARQKLTEELQEVRDEL
jgi:RNA polymerase sigma-70 factor, ECF subfamily